ncbi:Aldedh-domain-containing protein [Panus rudis PR-1116 ss-1]|nr:Aldedh-domain-containing protein [Panus rudis PR-1116 ss-1]
MPQTFTHTFDTAFFKGKVELPTGLFIDGQWVDGSEGKTIDVINPTTGKKIVDVAEGTSRDVDIAVKAAQKAFDTTWGLNAPGSVRAKFLSRLADIMEQHADELAAIESLDNGKTFKWARYIDTASTIEIIRYYSGWADKIQGKTIETNESKLVYTRHEPIGVVISKSVKTWQGHTRPCKVAISRKGSPGSPGLTRPP